MGSINIVIERQRAESQDKFIFIPSLYQVITIPARYIYFKGIVYYVSGMKEAAQREELKSWKARS